MAKPASLGAHWRMLLLTVVLFGLVALAGCVIDILANLFVLPLPGGAQWKKR